MNAPTPPTNKPPQPLNIQLEITPDIARGVYSNLALITNTEHEFILDFALVQPAAPKSFIGSRIILSPAHAKQLAETLQKNIAMYEAKLGKIKPGGGFGDQIKMSFN